MLTGRAFAAVAAAGAALVSSAGAEIVISPLRQVVTRQSPVATFTIVNVSDRIVDGRVDWIDLAALEMGYAEASPAERAKISAAPYVVVSPARFRLEPGKRAAVTVKLRKAAAIPAGERRSHLLIETTPVRTPLRRAGGGLEVDVELGVSAPVIVRKGLAAPAVAFGETRLLRNADGLLDLETTLTRQGKYSAYGRLTATLRSPGETRALAEIDNVALHVDAPSRRLRLPLAAKALPGGVLTLSYAGVEEFDGRLFAEKSFEIAPPQ